MTSKAGKKQDKIDHYIDQNLKKVFSDLEQDEMPSDIVDLLTVLRAQDEELRGDK